MPISTLLRPKFRTFFLAFLFLSNGDRLQANPPNSGLDTILLSAVRLSVGITPQTGIYIDTPGLVNENHFQKLPALYFIPVSMSRKLQAKYVSKSIFLQFSVKNDADTAASVYFLPGFYCRSINLFKYNPAKQKFEESPQLPGLKPNDKNIVSRLKLGPRESATFIAKLSFIKTTVNSITPILAQGFYLPTLYSQIQNERKLNSIITYLVCGIMLMMIFYSFAGYYTSRRMEFLYYSTYAFLLGIMFFFKAILYKQPIPSNFFFESYFDFILQASGTLFYFMFLRSFTNARNDFPFLNKVLFAQQVITFAGMLVFSGLNFFTTHFLVQNQVENLVKYAWSVSTIIFILFAILKKSHILRYLAIGHGFLFLFGFLSLYLINSPNRFNTTLNALVNDSLFWYEMGVLFELVFFMIALSYKNKQEITLRAREKERLLLEYEKSAIERKIEILAAQQDERNRISADMHDELGSGVTAIRLLSELAKTKMKENTPVEIEKISNSANDLITKMNTIIWTMKSSNDTVDNTIAYVRAYTAEFLDNTNLKYKVEYPESIAPIELTGEKRRNIFLCIKEALNNIAKHSKASEVIIGFQVGAGLVITIHDNGTGLNPEKMRDFSNGLANMRKRMENIDGHFSIHNENGTVVTLSVPLV
ncbi:sensor histidine kinase [Flavihumibacter fluvii]|uniref:sensor histidine kinase n=1 Tax=Flavihumibacter fluvii TaxID=2838157 RepID=UPI001BDE9C77|nr:7TM diverse intracellular signaling domain-containing protein [Flavihumibacter fluvii]ULQ52983.1 histidine kinase [Flavihumibacter fluvii]